MIKNFQFRSLLLSFSLFLGCSSSEPGPAGPAGPAGRDGTPGQNGVDGKNGANGQDACVGPDPNFWLILRDFDEAKSYRFGCVAEASADLALCRQDAANEAAKQICQDNYATANAVCEEYHAWRANKTIGRLCHAEVMHFDGKQSAGVTVDSDGDGLSNFEEFLLYLNPCSKTSYGSCVKDAELDGDFDGIPNGQDPLPYCNLNDPLNVSDCI